MSDQEQQQDRARAHRRRVLAATPAPGAAALTAVAALYMAVVVIGNVTDFGTNQQFVRHVLAMDTTFRDPDLMWRAVEIPALQDAAYVAVIIWEAVTAAVLLYSAWLWGAGLCSGSYGRARAAGNTGLVMMVLLFGLGFLVIGGEWFAMWQSEQWNGLDAATRSLILATATLLITNLPARLPSGR